METERNLIRNFVQEDLASLIPMLTDNEVMKSTGFKKALLQDQINELLEKWISEPHVWGAFEKKTNHFIGWFMLKQTISKDPELGFMLPRNQWGKGNATEIGERLVQFAKEELKVPRVIALVDLNNDPSINVLRKLGMKKSLDLKAKEGSLYLELNF